MITIPSVQPELLKALESDFGTTVAASIWKKIKEQEHYINASVPVGLIIFFFSDQFYAGGGRIAAPGASWKFCDGSVIASGPLAGQSVPDLRSRYPIHGATIGTLGGATQFSLPAHNHGGLTSYREECNVSSRHTDGGATRQSCVIHAHPVSMQGAMIHPVNPKHIELQPYMRIK